MNALLLWSNRWRFNKPILIFVMEKKQQKHSKILQKQLDDLHREVHAMNRKYHEKHNHPSEDEELNFIDQKALKWWQRFDQRHFLQIHSQQYLLLRDITTSDRILQQSPREYLPLNSYAQTRLLQQYELFREHNLIHVLFKNKNPTYTCLASYELEQVIPSYAQHKKDTTTSQSFTITPSSSHNTDNTDHRLKEIKLSLAGFNEDEETCQLAQDYKTLFHKYKDEEELDRQIILWQRELLSVNRNNNHQWDRLISSIKYDTPSPPDTTLEVARIKQYLMWVTVLEYFEHGHCDKTMAMLQSLIDSDKMLRPSKSKQAAPKKLFQTDCKICFCSLNNDCNQVLYCDECNTSFHLACYGLTQIPKEDKYYCDCCRYQRKQKVRKVMCQLCFKTSFPLKQLQGHFYHVTCLILFNLAKVQKGTLLLRQGVTHQKIAQMVIQSEVEQSQCSYCAKSPTSETGIRMKCSFKGCLSNAHPICAYINGCKFNVKRDSLNQKLSVGYICNLHDMTRDSVQQSYIRRYMCNLKGTSNMTLQQFRIFYSQQQRKRILLRSQKKQTEADKILEKTRFIKKILHFHENKNTQGTKILQTQSRRMLQKLYKSKH